MQPVGSDEARWPQEANVTGDGSSRDPPSWVSSDMGCGLHASRRTLAYWFQIDIILYYNTFCINYDCLPQVKNSRVLYSN